MTREADRRRMMKRINKITSLLVVLILMVTMFSGCGVKKPVYEIALITDVGTIDDKSFNQSCWEGVRAYAKDHKKSRKYYRPAEKSNKAFMDSIDLAIKGGAKIIVVPGFLFQEPIADAQHKYPDVDFIFVDSTPAKPIGMKGNETIYDETIEKNVYSITYKEEEAGYLAGRAAVADGYTNLGFMGGIAVPPVMRYGYGFVKGVDDGAKAAGLKKGDVTLKYTYTGNFSATPENSAKAASWYNGGTQCIFACGGAVGNSVMKSAEGADGKVIGVDVDQSVESDTVITSAMKNISKSVYDAIDDFYHNRFPGGQVATLSAKEKGVVLPMKTSKFKNFTQADYDSIYQTLIDGQVQFDDWQKVDSAKDLNVDIVNVELIK